MFNKGWICPVCGAVNAPWKATCNCGGKTNGNTYTWASSKDELKCDGCKHRRQPRSIYPCTVCIRETGDYYLSEDK